MDLADLLKGATLVSGTVEKKSRGYDTTIMAEAQITRLREDLKRYRETINNGCAFEVGDLVTPREEYSYNGCGQPHVVVEVRKHEEVLPHWSGSETGMRFGARHDMRVAVFVEDNTIAHFWVESFEFRYYDE